MHRPLLSTALLTLLFAPLGCDPEPPAGPTGDPDPTEEALILVPELFGEMPIWVEVVDGAAVHQGDIHLGPIDEFERVDPDAPVPRTAATTNPLRHWPEAGGVIEIPWVPLPNCSNNPAVQADFVDATLIWEERTDGLLQFQQHGYPWGGGPGDPRILVNCGIDDCYSTWIGMRDPGPQALVVGDCATANMVHEIGHALGMLHEQQRSDRDDFVDIHWSRITNPAQFAKYDPWYPMGADIGPFNADSLMMYGSCAFNTQTNRCRDYFYDQLSSATYVEPSMTVAGASSPYDVADTWQPRRVLDDQGGDLYGFARTYTAAWYVSDDGTGDWAPLNWHDDRGADVPADELLVGRFCDDAWPQRNGDDVLWLDAATGDCWAVCDGGYASWHHGAATQAAVPLPIQVGTDPDALLVGDFDGLIDGNPYPETFSDILVNDAFTGEWMLWLNGELGQGWVPAYPHTDDVADLATGSFCNLSGIEGLDDVVRVDPDTGKSWEVSCQADTDWIPIPGVALGDPADYLLADIDGDGYTDLVRNDGKMALEVAFAEAPPGGSPDTEPVVYQGFKTLAWKATPGFQQAGEQVDVTTLHAGQFRSTTTVPDGADLLRVEGQYWFVAESALLAAGKLQWQRLNDFGGYPDKPHGAGYNGFGTAHPPVLVGEFTGGDHDDVVVQLDPLQP